MLKSGITMYFRADRIRFRHRMLQELEYPEFIHLRINEQRKQLFIERCKRDKDAFRLIYNGEARTSDRGIQEKSCYIYDRPFLRYLSRIVGVPEDSRTLWFSGMLLADGKTVFVDLSHYEIAGPGNQDDIDNAPRLLPASRSQQ